MNILRFEGAERAACIGKPQEWWFPGDGTAGGCGGRWAYRQAREVCDTCPVKGKCLAFALEHETGYRPVGMFGGKSPKERIEIKRSRQNSA